MFARFIGIDWSGDRRRFAPGIQVAEARPGPAAPALLAGDGPGGRWSRSGVLALIERRCAQERCLIGLDFSFGFPHGLGAFDWDYAEACCAEDENFYGGRFFAQPRAEHADLVNGARHKGSRYSARALRQTELRAAAIKHATPQSVFNAVGAAQVGPSSIAGMRMLRALRAGPLAERLAIWPFDPASPQRSVVVEIFPRLFPLLHGLKPAMREEANLAAALAAYDSEPVARAPRSEDEGDALIAAAALRAMAGRAGSFDRPAEMPPGEGWIFGVPIDAAG